MVSRIYVPAFLGSVRLASVSDAPHVLDLLNESMSKTFRIENSCEIVYLIENSILSICQLDDGDEIVGFLVLRDYPMIPSLHPGAWEEYIWTKYKAVEMNARNTLFIHLFCWSPLYSREMVDNMLRSVFLHDPYVHHIAMTKCLPQYPLLIPGVSRPEGSFRRVQSLERGVPGDRLPLLCVADRSEVCPRLRIRRAVEEDNDDIVPIIERHSERLTQIYGEFYISELISRHPESERVLLVCEHKELAVGVMCLNTQINYEALEENFELSPFAGLRHLVCKSVLRTTTLSKDLDTLGSFLSSSNVAAGDSSPAATSNFLESLKRAKDAKTRVSWVKEEDMNKLQYDMASNIAQADYGTPLTQLDVLSLLEDEEEDFEFDIINIDKANLRVPTILTTDTMIGPAESFLKMINGKAMREVTDSKTKLRKKEPPKKITGATPMNNVRVEPMHYSGEPNAFLLELFAMHPDYDERHGFDILETAFELFPNRDYCVMCLPSNHPSFPLLEHFTLVTPYSSRARFINDTLYVAHVNSVRCELRVRPGEFYDLPALSDVLEHAPRMNTLQDLFESTLTSFKLQSFVFLSQNQPIGIVVLGPLVDCVEVRTQYDLEPEPRRPGTDCTILAGVMSPALEPHARWYMRELLRQSQYSTLFWICKLFAKGDSSPVRNLMSLAGHMNPVHPRTTIPNISGNKGLDKIFREESSPYSLWVLERPLTGLPKVYVNNSIVVIGASRTGLAFLETLFLGPTSHYLTFSNVTLVSEHGLPTVTEYLKAADVCVPRDGRYTDRYLKSVPFYFYLDVMTAVMVAIDRKKKCIYLKGGGVKFYDELVLTCGLQFQHPDYLKDSLKLVKEIEKGQSCERLLMDNPKYQPDRVPNVPELPENVMLVNSLSSANLCMRKLMRIISEPSNDNTRSLGEDNRVLVYGDCIEAYSCIAALLELGLTGNMIAFVEPFPAEDDTAMRVNCFNDETVDERVQESLEKLGITIYRKCFLNEWHHRDSRIVSIDLMAPLQIINVPCFALFYYGIKAIDLNAFRAINDCGLVYDGGLVVSPVFETNDPNIYGAGTCVRYSRKLYAKRLSHRYFCSEDVGEALAKMFLMKLDPFVMGNPDALSEAQDFLPRYGSSILGFKPSNTSLNNNSTARISTSMSFRRWQPALRFESPIVQYATLPGPLYYLKLRKPGLDIPRAVRMSLPHQGHTLMTDKNSNLFRLQLNVLHVVDSVTCLSKKSFSSEIISQLYGKHEAFFNKLLPRFLKNEIDDLYTFFTQPWMSALYQETFRDLVEDTNNQDVGTIYDLVRNHYSMYDSSTALNKSTVSFKSLPDTMSGCSSTSSFRNLRDLRISGTFRSMIDKFVTRTSTSQMGNSARGDIPSECGQCEALRKEARGFWHRINGDYIVTAQLARYLSKHNLSHPHYAACKPEYM